LSKKWGPKCAEKRAEKGAEKGPSAAKKKRVVCFFFIKKFFSEKDPVFPRRINQKIKKSKEVRDPAHARLVPVPPARGTHEHVDRARSA
jgi:hypothetical protein